MDAPFGFPATLKPVRNLMRGAAWPMRRPSFNDPPFWSIPLTQTAIVPVAGNSTWTTVLKLTMKDSYFATITDYVLTCYGSNALTNVSFRILVGQRFSSLISLVPGVEYNRSGASSFPTSGRSVFFMCDNHHSSVWLQANNPGPFQQFILAALYGWYAYNPGPTERSVREGLTDA